MFDLKYLVSMYKVQWIRTGALESERLAIKTQSVIFKLCHYKQTVKSEI